MIDIIKAKEAFKEYVKNYSSEDSKIAYKIAHTMRVSRISRDIAQNLLLDQEDIDLAELIGLLHDIGRFEQVKRYHTYIDKDSINHGEFGAKLLFEEGLIRNFIEEATYDTIIKTAILNHNRGKVEEGLTPKAELHSRIVRDADKVDIFSLLVTASIQDAYDCDSMYEDSIKPEIIRQFEQEHVIQYENIDNGAERIIAHFAYVFDFNFESALQIIQENEYIDKLASKYEFREVQTKEIIEKAAKIVKEYMKQKLK